MSKAALESKLREAELNFSDDGCFFRGVFGFGDGSRTQGFLIDYDADDCGGHMEHDFMSVIGPAEDASKVMAACELAGKKKRGGIVVIGGHICFKVEVGVDWSADVMRANLETICMIADEIEAQVIGGDRY